MQKTAAQEAYTRYQHKTAVSHTNSEGLPVGPVLSDYASRVRPYELGGAGMGVLGGALLGRLITGGKLRGYTLGALGGGLLGKGLGREIGTRRGLRRLENRMGVPLEADPNDVIVTKKAELQSKEREELAKDLAEQFSVYGPGKAEQAVPSEELRKRIREVEAGSDKQTMMGVGGAVGGGLLGGGFGALTTGLARGAKAAPFGAISGIPGALLGFQYMKGMQRKKELEKALEGY